MKKIFLYFICLLAFALSFSCSSPSGPALTTVQTEHITAKLAAEGVYFEIQVPSDGFYTARTDIPTNINYMLVFYTIHATSEGGGKSICFFLPYVEKGKSYSFKFKLIKTSFPEYKFYDPFATDFSSETLIWEDETISFMSEGGIGDIYKIVSPCFIENTTEKLAFRYLNLPSDSEVFPWYFVESCDSHTTPKPIEERLLMHSDLLYSNSDNKFKADLNGISWTLSENELKNLKDEYTHKNCTDQIWFHGMLRIPLKNFYGFNHNIGTSYISRPVFSDYTYTFKDGIVSVGTPVTFTLN